MITQDAVRSAHDNSKPQERGLLHPLAGVDWLASLLVVCSLLVFTGTLELASWAKTPPLMLLVFLGFLTASFLSILRIIAPLRYILGLAVGAITVLGFASTIADGNSSYDRLTDLFSRLELWIQTLLAEGISLDTLPFSFGLTVLVWTIGYVAGWAILSRRNAWLALLPGTGGIVANLCYIPDGYAGFLFLYLLFAILALARTRFTKRLEDLDRSGVDRSHSVGWSLMHLAVWFTIAGLSLSFALPHFGQTSVLDKPFQLLRSPINKMNNDLARLFAGLPGRKPMPYTAFGPVLPFQGTVVASAVPVLEVRAPLPMYWKARTYSLYTSSGWKTGDTELYSADWLPAHWQGENYGKQSTVEIRAKVLSPTETVYASGVSAVPDGLKIESYESPTYTVDLTRRHRTTGALPEDVREVIEGLENDSESVLEVAVGPQGKEVGGATRGPIELTPEDVDRLSEDLPSDLVIHDVQYKDGIATAITFARVLSNPPDILAVHSPGYLDNGGSYTIKSSFSYATPDDLRAADSDYPAWVRDRYLALPDTLPARVRQLAAEITSSASTAYDKAQALTDYLRGMPYSLKVEPPPYDRDGVDYFLFTLKEGYCNYFASALTVMLRSVGVPARLAVGFMPGEPTEDGVYLVRDSDSHAWTEVYFQGYGWVPFEATPGRDAPPRPSPAVAGRGEVMIPYREDEDFYEWFEEESPRVIIPFRPPTSSFNPSTMLPWLALPVVFGLLILLFWRRYMAMPRDAATAYRQMVVLTSLAGMGPKSGQTPYEYAGSLGKTLPRHNTHVQTISGSYVRWLYGAKLPPADERERLAMAWKGIRKVLVIRILARLLPRRK